MAPMALLHKQGSGGDRQDCWPKGQSLGENRLIERYAGQRSEDNQELRIPGVTRRILACRDAQFISPSSIELRRTNQFLICKARHLEKIIIN
jgi:hypothetical protein